MFSSPFFWIILSVLFTLGGDYFGRTWGVTQQKLWWFFGASTYALSGISFLQALKVERITVAVPYWQIIDLVLALLMGILLFHEVVGVRQWIGIMLLVGALVLIRS